MAESSPRLPLTVPIALSLFFTGITYASTLNYAAIMGIDTLGIPNGLYSVVLTISSLAAARRTTPTPLASSAKKSPATPSASTTRTA